MYKFRHLLSNYWERYRILIIFFSFDLLINIILAIKTEISDNECYFYESYSKLLEWGYAEYPPAVALFIKIGTFFLGANNLGIRFTSIVVNLLTKVGLWSLIKKEKTAKEQILFIVLYYSIIIFSYTGFNITPDVLLTCFFTLSIWVYNEFNKSPSLKLCVILGILLSTMIYSHHSGLLILFLLIISNKKFFNKKLYITSILIAIILYIPHLYWLYENQYLIYQLLPWATFQASLNSDFFLTFLLFFFCSIGPVFLIAFIVRGKTILFNKQKLNKLSIFLFLSLFVFYSIKYSIVRIESLSSLYVLCPPLFIVFNGAFNTKKNQYLLNLNFIVSLIIHTSLRLTLIYSFLPWEKNFTRKEKKVLFLDNIGIEGYKTIFLGSRGLSSKYSFFTQKETCNIEYLKVVNLNFKQKNTASSFNGDNVFLISEKYVSPLWDTIFYKDCLFFCKKINNFIYWGNSEIKNVRYEVKNNDSIKLEFNLIINNSLSNINADSLKIALISYHNNKIEIISILKNLSTVNKTYNSKHLIGFCDSLSIIKKIFQEKKNVDFALCILQDDDLFYFNSKFFKIDYGK